MEAFFGSWKFVRSENFDEFLTVAGIEEEMRNVIKVLKPIITISQEDDRLVIKSDSVIGKRENKFRFGEEFQEETTPDKFCTSVINLEGEKLVQVQKDESREITTVREIQDGKLIMTLTCDEVTAVVTYEKV
ncbi:fatty acid-binding protein, brain-like [Pangasianodon hypophthalmus]|uniref:fatty acid-binding protein, brain-like n=1 Tax=Pangasianodon hypophthalmus TaxID=310915 RepID=UPI00147E997C|nr:fatty acid-binding protein, brain-like [Pangasianodon hypophthalmus]